MVDDPESSYCPATTYALQSIVPSDTLCARQVLHHITGQLEMEETSRPILLT